jgi:hypothetical protein
MISVLPEPPGLDINAVIYRYTPIKDPNDPMKVHVQNENALGEGYIFRETDDWTGKQGGIELRKAVPVIPNLHRSYWGDGSIEVEGIGSIEDPSVIYSYRVDPCYDPQFDPNCPGYEAPTVPEVPESTVEEIEVPEVEIEVVEEESVEEEVTEVVAIPVRNPYDDASLNRQEKLDEEFYNKERDKREEEDKERAEREKEEEKDSQERLEKAMAAVDNSQLFADAFATNSLLDQMNNMINMGSYYKATIPGGVYNETLVMDGGTIPDNRSGRRMNLQSQILHEKMVDEQYNR